MKRLLTPLVLAAGLTVTGCATTAKGVSQSSISKYSTQQNLSVQAPIGTPLVVIRYPAFVEADAEEAYYKAFQRAAIGGNASKAQASDVNALADSLLLKSNFFALSLFKELASQLPEHSVLLSPHTLKLGADGALTSAPMTQAESLPNVISVDFTSYTFPDAEKMMGKEPLTFGDLVTPLLTARTNALASVPTQGLHMASGPLLTRAAGNGRAQALANLKALETGQLQPSIPELDFVAHLRGATAFTVPSKRFSGVSTDNMVATLPLEKLKLDAEILESYGSKTPSQDDPIRGAFSQGFANQIIGLINQTNIEKATMMGRAAAIAQFDESLAALTLIGSEDQDYLARLRYAERLLEAEQKYLSVQSLRLFDGVQNGEMGAQVRDILKAEYDILEKRRELARKQNTATALSVLGAVAAGAAIANQGGGENCSQARSQTEYRNCLQRRQRRANQTRVLTNAIINGTIVAAQQAYAINRQSKAVGTNFWNSIAPALESQTDIQVNLIDSNETITAIRFEDLKAKLQTLYTEKQRSLDTVATRCGYSHTASSASGTWLGVCENGLGNGPGLGILSQSDGTAIEYYGYAQNGQPQGAGYMVYHGQTQSYSVEGNFTAGQPDGVMRVSKGGSPDTLRLYKGGKDAGSAPSGQSHISPFKRQPSAIRG